MRSINHIIAAVFVSSAMVAAVYGVPTAEEVGSATILDVEEAKKIRQADERCDSCDDTVAVFRRKLAMFEKAAADAKTERAALIVSLAEKNGLKAEGRTYSIVAASEASSDGTKTTVYRVVAYGPAK